MVKSCCAVGCTNRYNRESGITFHRIPSDPVYGYLWIQAINRIDHVTKKLWTPSKYDVICSEHFHPDDFMMSRHGTLQLIKKTAVPSIFSWKQTEQSPCKKASASAKAKKEVTIIQKELTVQPHVDIQHDCIDYSYACQPDRDHTYASELDKMKRKYENNPKKLHTTQQELQNVQKREKQCRLSLIVNGLLYKKKEQQKLNHN